MFLVVHDLLCSLTELTPVVNVKALSINIALWIVLRTCVGDDAELLPHTILANYL